MTINRLMEKLELYAAMHGGRTEIYLHDIDAPCKILPVTGVGLYRTSPNREHDDRAVVMVLEARKPKTHKGDPQ